MRHAGSSALPVTSDACRRTRTAHTAGVTKQAGIAKPRIDEATLPLGRVACLLCVLACLLCVFVCLLMSGTPFASPTCSAAGDFSDILPPVISIVSPRPDASFYSPSSIAIEVEYTDIGSGVDPETAYLFVNGVDATTDMDVSEERAIYTLVGLLEGTCSVRFGISDRAGNRGEVAWSFEIHDVIERFDFSGMSQLRFDWKPLRKTTETLDLALTGRAMSYTFEGRARLAVTDYPGGRPVLSSGSLNVYLDRWSVALSRPGDSWSFGDVQVPFALELADIGRQMKGATGRAKLSLAGAGVEMQAFSGRISRSSGLGITVMDAMGAMAQYGGGQSTLAAAYVSLGRYDIASVSGRGILSSLVASAEVTYGRDHSSGAFGFGLATHFDTALGPTHVGVDLQLIEQSYPSGIAPSWLATGNGGALGLAVRTSTALAPGSTLRVDGAVVRDNLAGSRPTTSEQINVSIGYRYRTATGWTLGADHGYQQATTVGTASPGAGSTSKSYGLSASGRLSIRGVSLPAKGSITIKDSADAVTLKQTGSQALSLSMTVPILGRQLTPALTLKNTLSASGTSTWLADVKLGSIDLSLPAEVRATLSFSAKATARFPEGADVPDRTSAAAGVKAQLSRRVFRNSTVSLDAGISRWSTTESTSNSGWDQAIGISLSTRF